MTNIKAELKKMFDDDSIFFDEPMKKHVSFKIGGCADILVIPSNIGQIVSAINICMCTDTPFYTMGNGSNLLINDDGYRGVILKISNKMNNIRLEDENILVADSGASLAMLATYAYKEELTGFEFASGIPGTLGGAIYMNAGAYDGEMKNVVISADVLTSSNEIKTLTNKELQFEYRNSIIQKENLIVVSVKIKLDKGNKSDILEKMNDLNNRRREKQPLEFPSAGSTFKRPVGHFAGKLIMDSGLAGVKYGGAQVSTKHCGFIINTGDATCLDVINLIKHVKDTVYKNFNVELESEIRIIG